MNHVFWIGVYPGLTKQMLDFIITTMTSFIASAQGDLKIIP